MGTRVKGQYYPESDTWVVTEPPHGSVVLTESASGTAWQRHFSDGLWHSTTGQVKPWHEVGLHRSSGLPKFRALVYVAPQT